MFNKKKKIIIATGGTGGHVFPAFSLASYFLNKKISTEIVIDARGYKFIKNYNFPNIKIINSSTIYKKNPILFILASIKITFAFFKSLLLLIKSKPSIVFGMGGYASFPICIAAKILRIPFIIYESNLCIGKTNKYLLPLSYKLFVSYKETEGVSEKYISKKVEIGNIIRQEILNYVPKKKSNLEKKINILVLGGSQAAKSFADKLPIIFSKCLNEKMNLKIYQQCLPIQKENLISSYNKMKLEFELFTFNHNLISYFDKADLVITRSGASITAELLNSNLPFISIPFPFASDNHQFKNAKYFKEKGYSFLVEEKDIDSKLLSLIKSIHADKEILNQIINKQKLHSDKLVFKKIENEIKNFIDEQY